MKEPMVFIFHLLQRILHASSRVSHFYELVEICQCAPVFSPSQAAVRGDSSLLNTLEGIDNRLERPNEYNEVMEESGEEDDALSR